MDNQNDVEEKDQTIAQLRENLRLMKLSADNRVHQLELQCGRLQTENDRLRQDFLKFEKEPYQIWKDEELDRQSAELRRRMKEAVKS